MSSSTHSNPIESTTTPFFQAITNGDAEEVRRQLTMHNWMKHADTVITSLKTLNNAMRRKRLPLTKKAATDVAMVLLEQSNRSPNPLTWHKAFQFACENMDMDAVWPGFVLAQESKKLVSMESVLLLALRTQKAPLPAWVTDALQRQPNNQHLSGSVFWQAAFYPDAMFLIQLMQHPSRPSPKKILDAWMAHSESPPIHLDEVRKHICVKEVLSEAVYLAMRARALGHNNDMKNLEPTLQFWWDALTPEEKTEWLHYHEQEDDSVFLLPIVNMWNEQQALQAVKPTSAQQTTRKTRL